MESLLGISFHFILLIVLSLVGETGFEPAIVPAPEAGAIPG